MKAGIRHDERPSSVTVARGIALAVVIAIIIAFIFFDPYMVCAVLFIAFAVSLIIYGAFLKQNELRFYERYGGKHPKK
jgi:maltodextrin utilization protein YvdJ